MDVVLLHAIKKYVSGDLQILGGLRAVPAAPVESLSDDPFLGLMERKVVSGAVFGKAGFHGSGAAEIRG